MSLTRRRLPWLQRHACADRISERPRAASYPQPAAARNSESLRLLRSRRGKSASGRAARTSGISWSRGMSAGGGTSASSGQSARHVPVLLSEAIELLAPRSGGIYVDATFGAGGYSRAILAMAGTQVIGIDRDRSAITAGFDLVDRSDGRLVLVEDRFSNLADVCRAQGRDAVDGVVMDIGVSSMQLDQAERGFSFRLDGPLDMRMGREGASAADVVAAAAPGDLARIIAILGEEKFARPIARAIAEARQAAPITTTRALGRHHLARGAPASGRNSSRDAHVPGAADLRQRRARRTAGSAARGRGDSESRRTAGGRVVPFAGGPHRQDVPRRPFADRGRIAASAGSPPRSAERSRC